MKRRLFTFLLGLLLITGSSTFVLANYSPGNSESSSPSLASAPPSGPFSFESGDVINTVSDNVLVSKNTATNVSIRLTAPSGGTWRIVDNSGSGYATGNTTHYAIIETIPLGANIQMDVDLNDDGTFGDAFKLNTLQVGDPSFNGGDFTFKPNNSSTNAETLNVTSLAEFSTFTPSLSASFDGITSLGIDLAPSATGILLDNIDAVSPTTPVCDQKVHLRRSDVLVSSFCSIQDAVDNAQDGDIINLEAGTFTEQVSITKAITLQGAGQSLTIIQSPTADKLTASGGNWKTLKNQDMIAVIGVKTNNSKMVNIKDLTVDGMNQGYMPDAVYPDKMQYAFVGIGAINSSLIVDNVKVTRVRALATDYSGVTLPAGYLPADQPSGMNHNDAIFAESALTADEHTFELKNSYIDKFQKDAVLAWGPTLTVNIHDNTIQGYGQTLWSTGNGIQVASSDRTASGGANGDRRGTKGKIRNNSVLDIGLVIPKPGQEGSYLNLGLLSPSAILLWEAGDNFEISGNTLTRSITTKSWHVDYTSADGGYGSMGIGIVSSIGTLIKNNEISGFDEAITAETYQTQPSLLIRNNVLYDNTIDYGLLGGANTVELGSAPEVTTYYSDSPSNDVISNFGHGDAIQVVKLSTGVINGLLNGKPSIDFSNGTSTAGDGSNVAAYSVQVQQAGSETYLYIDTDGQAGQAELKVTLKGKYVPGNFFLSKSKIFFQYAVSALNTNDAADITTTSAILGGEITADGGATVFEQGVVYSSSNQTPTIGGESTTHIIIDSDINFFEETVNDLTANTTYYVRAYARNSVGVAYGEVKTFKTLDDATTGTINDTDARLILKTAPGLLKVFNIPDGQSIQIFDGTGKVIQTIAFKGKDIEVALPQRGLYIVKTGNTTGKVIIP